MFIFLCHNTFFKNFVFKIFDFKSISHLNINIKLVNQVVFCGL